MTYSEFDIEMSRLRKTFAATAYGEERTKLIWQEVSWLPIATFRKMVDIFIGSFKSAPLIPDFRDMMAKVRAEAYEANRVQHKKDADDFWAGTYHTDDIKVIVGTIKRRLLGQCSDEEWASHMATLSQAERKGR